MEKRTDVQAAPHHADTRGEKSQIWLTVAINETQNGMHNVKRYMSLG